MQVQRPPSQPLPPSGPASPATKSATTPASPSAQPGSSPLKQDAVQIQSTAPEQLLENISSQASAQADQLEKAWKGTQSGNLVSRTFNSVLGKATGHENKAQVDVAKAVAKYRELPQLINQLRQDLKAAEKNPAQSEKLLAAFRATLQSTETLGKAAEAQLGLVQSSNKFWSGLTAEITSTLLVTSAAALAVRKLGMPMNAATAAAGFVLGGSTNVATHALFDNQYDVKREGLGNFLTAGISSSAMVITAKPGTTTLTRMVTTQAVVAGTTAGAGAVAREYEQGFQAGWQKRVATGTMVGAGVGVITGAAGSVVAKVMPQGGQNLVQKGIHQATTGAVTGTFGAGVAGTLNEAFNGFSEGWQTRVQQQMVGGAITGAVLSFAPSIQAEPKAQIDEPSPIEKTQAPPAQAPETEAPQPKAPSPEMEPSSVLSYADNPKLRDFDKLVSEHASTYDPVQKAQPQYLLDADGQPIPFKKSDSGLAPGYGYGGMPTGAPMPPGTSYGNAPPGLIKPDGSPLNPNPNQPDYGTMFPPSLVKPDGTPINPNVPSYGYAPSPALIKPDGTPLNPNQNPYPGSMPYPSMPVPPSSPSAAVSKASATPAVQTGSSYTTDIPEFKLHSVPTATMGSVTHHYTLDAVVDAPTAMPTLTGIAKQHHKSSSEALSYYEPTAPTLHSNINYTTKDMGSFFPAQLFKFTGSELSSALALQTSMSSAIQFNKPVTLNVTQGFGSLPPLISNIPAAPSYDYSNVPPSPIDSGMPPYGYGTAPTLQPGLIKPDGTPLIEGNNPYYTPGLLNADGTPMLNTGYGNPPTALVNVDGTPVKGSLKDHIYTDIFQDNDLRDKTVETFGQWTATFSASTTQSQLRDAWSNIMKGQEPSTTLEKTVMDIYTTRHARWERLADKMGLDSVPKEFQLYRGVSSEFFVEAVVKAWKDTSSPDMQIPSHELSSWSLTRSTAEGFGGNPNASVVYEANIPFERTLADKYVDDGTFITTFSHENEVVVATSEKNTLTTAKDKATVKFMGKTYTYAERNSLIAAWDAAQAAKPPAGSAPQPPSLPGLAPMPGYPSPSYPSMPSYPAGPPPVLTMPSDSIPLPAPPPFNPV